MSDDNQSGQQRIVGEMFDAANIAQPEVPTETRGFTVDNVQQPLQKPQTEDNGFTSDNIQQPNPQPEQEKNNE